MKTYVHFIVAGDKFAIKALLCNIIFILLTLTCSSAIHTVHCCVYIATVVTPTRHNVALFVGTLPVVFSLYVVTFVGTLPVVFSLYVVTLVGTLPVVFSLYVVTFVGTVPVVFSLYVVTTSENVSNKMSRSECNGVLATAF
jgi:hypothetical protein